MKKEEEEFTTELHGVMLSCGQPRRVTEREKKEEEFTTEYTKFHGVEEGEEKKLSILPPCNSSYLRVTPWLNILGVIA